MRFRPAARKDQAAVEAIWQEQNRLHTGLEPTIIARADPVMPEQKFREILADPLQEIAVAEDVAVVGAALLVERHPHGELQVPRSIAFVHEICILESHRRRGIGRSFIGYIDSWARSRGLDAIELNVWSKNEDALAFYRALEFDDLRVELHRRVR